jgi:hypothetical protein
MPREIPNLSEPYKYVKFKAKTQRNFNVSMGKISEINAQTFQKIPVDGIDKHLLWESRLDYAHRR